MSFLRLRCRRFFVGTPGNRSSDSPAVVLKGNHFQSVPVLQNCSLLTILLLGYHLLFLLPASEEVMENPVDLIQRLLEIQSGGSQRSPELMAEDERLIERLRSQAERSTQAGKFSPH